MSGKQDKAGSGAGSRKSTSAGSKSRGSATRKSTPAGDKAPPAAKAPKERPHLRAVTSTAEPEPPRPLDPEVPGPEGNDASDPRFKRGDLIEAVGQRTALKRSDSKLVLELVLEELGKALDGNDDLVLPPLGKLMVKNRKSDADGPGVLTVRIRRPRVAGEAAGESPLADPGEDG
ncbi:hypothetical protein HKCCSP123_09390 [Rhodobacterales bacterium HKCCSP123]|nr:hypothetical protein [Rhodobacterales bacterium HKCCSP123]